MLNKKKFILLIHIQSMFEFHIMLVKSGVLAVSEKFCCIIIKHTPKLEKNSSFCGRKLFAAATIAYFGQI